jgi:hypothetical protein
MREGLLVKQNSQIMRIQADKLTVTGKIYLFVCIKSGSRTLPGCRIIPGGLTIPENQPAGNQVFLQAA